MAKIISLIVLVTFSISAQAGIGGCIAEQSVFTCHSFYHSVNSKSVNKGPSGQALVEDIQPEPFEFSVCQASVVFDTSAGKFVAVYDADSSTVRSWINKDGKDNSIVKEALVNKSESLVLNYQNSAQDQSSVQFVCVVK